MMYRNKSIVFVAFSKIANLLATFVDRIKYHFVKRKQTFYFVHCRRVVDENQMINERIKVQ